MYQIPVLGKVKTPVDGSAKVNGRFLKYEASSGQFVGDAGPQPDNLLLEDGTGGLVLDTSDDAGDNLLYEDGTGDFLLVLASHGIELKDHFTFSN